MNQESTLLQVASMSHHFLLLQKLPLLGPGAYSSADPIPGRPARVSPRVVRSRTRPTYLGMSRFFEQGVFEGVGADIKYKV